MIKGNVKALKVSYMGILHGSDEILFGTAFGLRSDHDGCTMRVVSTQVNRFVTTQSLEPCEDICLDIFDEMPKVNVTVGVRKSRSNQDSAGFGHDAL